MNKAFTIYESGEMYLETILKLKNENKKVRSIDIVDELGFSKSSVSRAVNLLKSKSFIIIAADGSIEFTSEGADYAREIIEKHRILTDYLIGIGVSAVTAEEDACKIEHVISAETFEKIKNLVKYKEV